ncbi:MAG: hypothetical protein GW913_08750 [Myxococcales bacterium]|nr:hypothetical protein [Myxococcales bacterium]
MKSKVARRSRRDRAVTRGRGCWRECSAVDITECAQCGGRLHLVEVVSVPAQIAKVLHGHVARGPPPQLLGQLELDFAV